MTSYKHGGTQQVAYADRVPSANQLSEQGSRGLCSTSSTSQPGCSPAFSINVSLFSDSYQQKGGQSY